MNKVKLAFAAILTSALMSFSVPSYAITAGDLLEENGSSELYSYLAGLADMLAYLQFMTENDQRGECIYDWFYRTEGSLETVHKYLQKYADKQPEAIMIVLAKRACPLKTEKN